jgi:hypothetical protein
MQFAIPVKIVNLATNGTIFASNHSVLIGGAPAEYGDNSVVRYHPVYENISCLWY